jgi:tRNA(Arg) A34 adenosine deaminase TadA
MPLRPYPQEEYAMLYVQVHLTLPAWVHDEIDTGARYETDEQRVGLAIRLSGRNVELDTGGPFGAAVFDAAGRVIAAGVNRVVPHNCSVAHAEMMAFMTAQARTQRHRLNEDGQRYILATSAQPCCQCYGASVWAGIDEMLIGARSEDVEELTEFDEGPLPADWIGELQRRGVAVRRDILRDEARAVLAAYSARGGLMY